MRFSPSVVWGIHHATTSAGQLLFSRNESTMLDQKACPSAFCEMPHIVPHIVVDWIKLLWTPLERK
jgi:hypothetical protein